MVVFAYNIFLRKEKEGRVLSRFGSTGVERGATSLIPRQTLSWDHPSQCYPSVFACAAVLNVHHVLTLHVWEPAFPSDISPVEPSLPSLS